MKNFKTDLESLHRIVASVKEVNDRIQLTVALENLEKNLESNMSQRLASLIVKMWNSEVIHNDEYEDFVYKSVRDKSITIEQITNVLNCSRATAYRKLKDRKLNSDDFKKISLFWNDNNE